ncbi:MAG TPA: hypothetical protein EYP88_01010 [Anaerolineales bacterium]|nr:hypothetical protein [Anaerolineales bacterium]
MSTDAFDYVDDTDEPQSKTDSGAIIWNILAVVMLGSAICLGAIYMMIFINPYSGLNPFPPPTMPVLVPTITPTPTLRALLPPTWTPTATTPPTETPTPEPTYTLTPEGMQPTATRNPAEGMPFIMQEGNPQYIPNIYHPDAGCAWMGVGGQVVGLNGGPVLYLSIKLGGSINGESVDLLTISGTAPQYGQAGYEFKLSEQPVDSAQQLYVQLLDQADLPLSEKYYFDTFNDCEKNLILINFKQIH